MCAYVFTFLSSSWKHLNYKVKWFIVVSKNSVLLIYPVFQYHASFKFYLRWLYHNCLCYLSIKDVVSFLKRFNLFITSLNIKGCLSLREKIPIPFIMMGAFPFRQIFAWPLEELFLLFLFMISDTWICLWMTVFILLLFTF